MEFGTQINRRSGGAFADRTTNLFDQSRPVQRLGEEAEGARPHGSRPDMLFGKGGNKDDRQRPMPVAQKLL